MKKILVLLFLTITYASGLSQEKETQTMKLEENLKEYTFVMLKRGTNRSQDEATAQQLQQQHLAYLNQMAKDGKLAVAGPFGDDGEWRGILIFKTQTLEEARRLVEQDPMVKAGRLSYEIHPWWTMKGSVLD